MRVMMSAAGSAVAPGIIRHLQSLSHYVIGHDCCDLGRGASVVDEFHKTKPFNRGYSDVYSDLRDVKFDLYLPFLDEELCYIQSIDNVILSPGNTLSIFTNKIRQQIVFEREQLPVAPQADGGKVIAKPRRGRGGKGIICTDDNAIITELMDSNFIVQRFVEGDEYTVDVLTGLDGEFLFAVPRLRIQTNGVSVIGQIKMDEEIVALARLIVGKFAFRGPINIQMIREHETGKLYIIELNPRLSGSCMFTVIAGFDILDATIKLWEGKTFVPPEKVEEIIVRRHYVEERL